jgi:hypothetical protein
LKTAGIYSIPCECGKVYKLGIPLRPVSRSTTGTSDYHPDKSGMAEHSINLGNFIQFQDMGILVMIFGGMEHIQVLRSRCMECIIREAIEIGLHPSNMKREGFL